ncbi:MAG TPA: hypothetical protein VGG85_02220 [Terracidiphilus sp.]|jgi:hypothetical protein
MKNMAKFVLGAAVLASGLGLGATKAQAAEFGVYIGGPNYVPPSPGPGYEWTAGYYTNGYWVPGRWGYVGGYDRDRVVRYDHDRDSYRDHDRNWDRGRDGDRDRHVDHDRDHFRR